MKAKLFSIIYISLFYFVNKINSQIPTEREYVIVLEDEIYVEKYDSTVLTKGKYTDNNECYKAGNKLIYDYYYQDLNGRKYKFEPLEITQEMEYAERQKAWRFVNFDSINEHTIDKVLFTVDTNNNNILYSFPGFDQSVITYDYLTKDGTQALYESTGLVENEKNVWVHPPRNKMFRVLELNPFPFIQAPYEPGNKWSWTLNNIRGSSWGDERWQTWEGIIECTSDYEITGKQPLTTPIGVLECFIIQSTASTPFGKTYLTAYFNMDVGFIKLDYTNIDSTKLVLEVVEISKEGNE